MQLDGAMTLVTPVKHDPATAPISDTLRALLNIAGCQVIAEQIGHSDGGALVPHRYRHVYNGAGR